LNDGEDLTFAVGTVVGVGVEVVTTFWNVDQPRVRLARVLIDDDRLVDG
jgi:hypothetical protein